VHDLNIGGGHEIVTSNRKVPSGAHRLGVHVERLRAQGAAGQGLPHRRDGLYALIDGEPAGAIQTQLAFNNFISWSGLDIGRDRSSPGLALRGAVRIHRANC
jgi:arylsulfatase